MVSVLPVFWVPRTGWPYDWKLWLARGVVIDQLSWNCGRLFKEKVQAAIC